MRGNKRCRRLQLAVLLDFIGAAVVLGTDIAVLDEFTVERQDDSRRPQQFGFQHLMEVERVVFVSLHQAVRTMAFAKADQSRGIDQQYRPAQQAGGVESFHAQQR